MLWHYTRHEMKVLLITTLCVSAGCTLVVSHVVQREPIDDLSANTVGVFAGVAPNVVNTRMDELNARERVLNAREAAYTTVGPVSTRLLFVEIVVGMALLGLILLNFYLDHRRRVHVV